jgi:ribosomal protein L37AE/L43A
MARERARHNTVLFTLLPREEVTIMAIQFNRRPIFGMNCPECGDLLIVPEWSEYEDERHVLHLWSCTDCGCEFETQALLPAAEAVDDAATIKAFFPSLLV